MPRLVWYLSVQRKLLATLFERKTLQNSKTLFSRCMCTHPQRRHSKDILYLAMSLNTRKGKKGRHGAQVKVPSEVYLHVAGTGAPGEPKSLILVTPSTRYLFQCSEGTQRLMNEHKLKLTSLKAVFITHKAWKNVSGLPGIVITLQENACSRLTLFGPPECGHFLNDVEKFRITEVITIDSVPYTAPYQDKVVTVTALPIYGKQLDVPHVNQVKAIIQKNWGISAVKEIQQIDQDIEDDDDSVLDSDINIKRPRKRVSADWRINHDQINKEVKRSKVEGDRELALVYLCQLSDYPGKLMMEKCVQQKVPVGHLLARLKAGHDVTLEDGRVVRAVDVKEPDIPGVSFLVVDCPSEDFISSLLSLKDTHSAMFARGSLAVVVHLAPAEVVASPRYQQWMDGFDGDVSHIMMNESCTGTYALGMCRSQTWMNMISDDIFPLLAPQTMKNEVGKEERNVTVAKPGMKIWLRPRKGFDGSFTIKNVDFLEELKTAAPDLQSALTDMKQTFKDSAKSESSPTHAYPEVVFLGTNSACPSKTRNVSSILVHTSADTCILLDTGEATLHQLWKFYGPETADILKKLKCIFISHKHADHHMGLFSILSLRAHLIQQVEPPCRSLLWLLTPRGLSFWYDHCLRTFHDLYNLVEDGNFEFLSNHSWVNHNLSNPTSSECHRSVVESLQLQNLETVYARHIYDSYGIVLTLKNGQKLVYSGDTMPNDNLVTAGQDCDLLIHEATFADEEYMEEMAARKKHCTQKQALEVAERMKAKFTILTHFSARFSKMPSYQFNPRVGLAFDMMRVNMGNLWQLPYFAQPLKIMYERYLQEHMEKDQKKAWQLQMLKANKQESSASNIT